MKASEFALFFGYELVREEAVIDGIPYRYKLIDKEGAGLDKLIMDIKDMPVSLAFRFNKKVDLRLIESGFKPSEHTEDDHYKAALAYIEEHPRMSYITDELCEVVKCICEPEELENDVYEDDPENVKGFVYDYFTETYMYARKAVDELIAQENKSLLEIIDTVHELKEDSVTLYGIMFQEIGTVCLEDFLARWHVLLNKKEAKEIIFDFTPCVDGLDGGLIVKTYDTVITDNESYYADGQEEMIRSLENESNVKKLCLGDVIKIRWASRIGAVVVKHELSLSYTDLYNLRVSYLNDKTFSDAEVDERIKEILRSAGEDVMEDEFTELIRWASKAAEG